MDPKWHKIGQRNFLVKTFTHTGEIPWKTSHTVIRFVSNYCSAKFGICLVVGQNGTLVEAKIHT